MADIFGDLIAGSHVAAQAGQRFAEGAHINIHFVFQTKVAGRTPAAFSQDTQSMGIIHHDPGPVLFGQAHYFWQFSNIAAHAEYAIGDNKTAGGLRYLLQLALQILHIGMVEAQHFAVAQLAAIVDAGMVFFIADDIVAPPHNGTDDAEIGLKTGGKGNNGLLVQETGQLGLQFQVHFQSTIEKTGTGTAGAVLFKCFDAGFDDLRAGSKTQIVIGTQHNAAAALHNDFRGLAAFQGMEIGINPLFFQFAGQGWLAAFFK